jgi:hypothetical protein
MAVFKQHCAFGFWKVSRLNDPYRFLNPGEEFAAGSFGCINTIDDLPAQDVLKGFMLQTMKFNESRGVKTIVKKTIVEKMSWLRPIILKL